MDNNQINMQTPPKAGEAMTAVQCLLARTALRLTVRQACEMTGTSHATIVEIERDRPRIKFSTRVRVRAAFEKAGITFNNDGINIRYRPGA